MSSDNYTNLIATARRELQFQRDAFEAGDFGEAGGRAIQIGLGVLPQVLDALESVVRDRNEARARMLADLRWLGKARADYYHGPAEPFAATDLSTMDAAIFYQYKSAQQLADILDGTHDGVGWLPSWRWDEWELRRAAAIREEENK